MARHLEVLEARAKITGYVETVTALHVGAGRGMQATASDLPVMLDAYGFPFIPGSSLKGSLRSQVEAAFRAVAAQRGEDPKLWACDVVQEDYCIPNKEDWERDAVVLERACKVCKLFGGPYLASRVYISDLRVDLATWDPQLLQVRDGVAIDRESLTAAEKKKFDFEVVPPGVRFSLEIVVENPKEEELGLLLWALQLYNEGYGRLGGASSRGTGRVRIVVREVQTRSVADLFAPLPLTERSDSSPPSQAQEEEEDPEEVKRTAALDKLREVLMQVPSMTLARLQREGPSLYGLSEKKLRERYGIKNLDQLLKLAQERGLIQMEEQRISLVAPPSEEEADTEAPEEEDRLTEYLEKYLPALQRWIQVGGKDQPQEQEGDDDV